MKPYAIPIALTLLSAARLTSGAEIPSACANLSVAEQTPESLSARIAAARSARLALPGDDNARESKQCESVVMKGFERLGKIKTPAAAEAVAKLVLDKKLALDSADRPAIASYIIEGGLGPLVSPLLRSHTDESLLARDIVSCVGQKTCM
jgi:hypothetical protein